MASMADASPLMIVADDREAASPVPQALKQIPGIELQFHRLGVGDYEVEHREILQQKTVSSGSLKASL